jgi:NADH-quinone oxidoreductase subunit L
MLLSLANLASTILIAPLLCGAVCGLGAKRLGKQGAHSLTIAGLALAFVASIVLAYQWPLQHQQNPRIIVSLFTWLQSGTFNFHLGLLIDPLSILMCVTVSFISLLVHVYSIGYMHDDPGYQRFFCYMSLFTFAMLTLVLADNMLQLFFGWEGVGLVSYLLIGFWFERPSAAAGCLKAFIVNRVGDFGLLLGVGLLFAWVGSLNYTTLFQEASLLASIHYGSINLLELICFGLFLGAMGKSAQIPLHVWLPESMEGPTPISALIHAATMVTAGIYMISRLSPLFELAPHCRSFILIVGATGALLLGLVGIVQHDIKRVVAYSTLSQLGYMIAATGVSAYSVAMFHLVTHACFKALLFLAAGSVIVAMHHEQDMRKMGGLAKSMPITAWSFLIGSMALTAIPPFSGFFSKDAIISAVHLSSLFGARYASVCLSLGVMVTVIYSFRAYILTFHGPKKFTGTVKECGPSICIPLILLSIPSLFLGMFLAPYLIDPTQGILASSITLSHHAQMLMQTLAETYQHFTTPLTEALGHLPFWLMLISLYGTCFIYAYHPKKADWCAHHFKLVYTMMCQKFGFDLFYQAVIVRNIMRLSALLDQLGDQKIIDQHMILGLPKMTACFASQLRKHHTGYLYHYLTLFVLGVILLLGYLAWHNNLMTLIW